MWLEDQYLPAVTNFPLFLNLNFLSDKSLNPKTRSFCSIDNVLTYFFQVDFRLIFLSKNLALSNVAAVFPGQIYGDFSYRNLYYNMGILGAFNLFF